MKWLGFMVLWGAAACGESVLVATELVHTDRAYGNAAPMALRERGRLCHPSAHRAVSTLAAMVEYAEFRRSRG